MLEIRADGSATLIRLQFKEYLISLAFGRNWSDSAFLGLTGRMKRFKLSYFFNINTNRLNPYNQGNHEFRFSYAQPHITFG